MRYRFSMRTTLTIDDDVLETAKAMADQQRLSLGAVISALARQALTPSSTPEYRNGILLLPHRPGVVVTTEMINVLRDELP